MGSLNFPSLLQFSVISPHCVFQHILCYYEQGIYVLLLMN